MVRISFDEPQPPSASATVQITAAAAGRIALLQKKYGPDAGLRIQVKGGGCHGFSYIFDISPQPNQTQRYTHPDHPYQAVFLDANSLQFLNGSTIDYQETLEASQFVIHNPQAHTGCGCGNSFSL